MTGKEVITLTESEELVDFAEARDEAEKLLH